MTREAIPAETLKAARQAAGVSVTELARRLGPPSLLDDPQPHQVLPYDLFLLWR